VDLAVIDPLASFLPGRGENHAGLMLEALQPLQRLTARGMAVLLLHHPKKGPTREGQAARGSGALNAHADISLEMFPYASLAEEERRRVLVGYSRFEETPRRRLIEQKGGQCELSLVCRAAERGGGSAGLFRGRLRCR
jgi:hypothetical protein